MERKRIVAANWKMNTLHAEAIELALEVLEHTKKLEAVSKIIFPPFTYLHEISGLIKGKAGFATGAQNCSNHIKGAFTGEISAPMIKSLDAEYVLIGHSERRAYFNEDAALLTEKAQLALNSGLQIIYCVGESLDERKTGKQEMVVQRQLKEVLASLPKQNSNSILVAYEPVWAIGTGETANPSQAQEMHAFIRTVLAQIFDAQIAETMPILYGGSCNPQNAKELFACKDVDGGLIGGASLKANEFTAIVNSFS